MSPSSPDPNPNVDRNAGRLSSVPATVGRLATLDTDPTGKNFDDRARALAKERFLQAFAIHGTIRAGCSAAGINRRTYYWWAEHDGEFVKGLEEAREDYQDSLREEIRRRAVEGVVKYKRTYYKGEMIDELVEREYSDTLLLAAAKSHLPEYKKEDEEGEDKKIPLSALKGVLDAINGGEWGAASDWDGGSEKEHESASSRAHARDRARVRNTSAGQWEDPHTIDVEEYTFKDNREGTPDFDPGARPEDDGTA